MFEKIKKSQVDTHTPPAILPRRDFLRRAGLGALAIVAAACGKKSEETGNRVENFEPRIETKEYVIGDKRIVVSHTIFGNGQLFFNMHDNEKTSVDTAMPFIKQLGGSFLHIENEGERLISFQFEGNNFLFDPNRIFNAYGVKNTLRFCTPRYNGIPERTKHAVENMISRFAQQLVRDFRLAQQKVLITLHNNTPDGSLTIESEAHSDEVKDANINPNQDHDDMIFVTHERDFLALSAEGYNVILHNPNTNNTDGSLVAFASLHKIRYVNVDAQNGHSEQQTQMYASVLKLLQSP